MSTLNEELTSLKLTVAELEKERSVALTHLHERVQAVWSHTSLNGDARVCTHHCAVSHLCSLARASLQRSLLFVHPSFASP